MSETERLIFHIDVNCAFLSWESVKRQKEGGQDLRLIPAVIGGDPEKRTSVVTARSIPAKKFGIKTGEPVSMAIRKCPGLVVAEADFGLYSRCSKAFKEICREYTPVMESFSIDEVFMDMSGMGRIYADPVRTAYEIKDRIRKELGFTVNVGIGRCRLCAKMASDFEKPDRVHTLFPEEIPAKMWPLPVADLFLCGKTSAEKLTARGIRTIGELAEANPTLIRAVVGVKHGIMLQNYARGIDSSEVKAVPEEAKGYSAETTPENDLTDIESICRYLLAQADMVSARMRADGARCSCVAVSYRTAAFQNKSHQVKLADATDSSTEIYETAQRLIKECWEGQPLRLIGLALSDVDHGEYQQYSISSLMPDDRRERLKKLDAAMDSIRGKYGNASVQRAGILKQTDRVSRKYQAEHQNRVDDENEKREDLKGNRKDR